MTHDIFQENMLCLHIQCFPLHTRVDETNIWIGTQIKKLIIIVINNIFDHSVCLPIHTACATI